MSGAIIDDTRNNSSPFYFLTELSVVSLLVLACFVDLEKSRREQDAFLEKEEKAKMMMRGKGDGESETVIA
jgi:hypothetical protein